MQHNVKSCSIFKSHSKYIFAHSKYSRKINIFLTLSTISVSITARAINCRTEAVYSICKTHFRKPTFIQLEQSRLNFIHSTLIRKKTLLLGFRFKFKFLSRKYASDYQLLQYSFGGHLFPFSTSFQPNIIFHIYHGKSVIRKTNITGLAVLLAVSVCSFLLRSCACETKNHLKSYFFKACRRDLAIH